MKKAFPKTFLFDLDGTLVQSLEVMQNSYKSFVKELGGIPSDEEFQSLNGPPLQQVTETLASVHLSDDDYDLDKLLSHYLSIIRQNYEQVETTRGAVEFMKYIVNRNANIGIVTSNSRQITNNWLARVGLSNVVSSICTLEDVSVGKPSPEPYLLALNSLNAYPEDCFAFEDSEAGFASAVCAGIETGLINNEFLTWNSNIKTLIFEDFVQAHQYFALR